MGASSALPATAVTAATEWGLGEIAVRDLHPDEIPQAVRILARGMRDNPLHVATYGADPARRVKCHWRLMRRLFQVSPAQQICALEDGKPVGVLRVAPVGMCQPSAADGLGMLPGFAALGPRTAVRTSRWIFSWAKRDPDEPHVHLGPFAVDAHLQGRGIGTLIMQEHCRRLDAAGEVGYLETDKPENVRFYERFGFVVVGEEAVLGVPNWFMRRGASAVHDLTPASGARVTRR
jgi:ribosomal protein S18 acetylase RimI-like enzyme